MWWEMKLSSKRMMEVSIAYSFNTFYLVYGVKDQEEFSKVKVARTPVIGRIFHYEIKKSKTSKLKYSHTLHYSLSSRLVRPS